MILLKLKNIRVLMIFYVPKMSIQTLLTQYNKVKATIQQGRGIGGKARRNREVCGAK